MPYLKDIYHEFWFSQVANSFSNRTLQGSSTWRSWHVLVFVNSVLITLFNSNHLFTALHNKLSEQMMLLECPLNSLISRRPISSIFYSTQSLLLKTHPHRNLSFSIYLFTASYFQLPFLYPFIWFLHTHQGLLCCLKKSLQIFFPFFLFTYTLVADPPPSI